MKTEQKIYQVSTLQALAMGYTRAVVSVGDFLKHGDIGLGTFENVDGEMIFEANDKNPDLGILNISMCAKMLINAGIKKIIYLEPYPDLYAMKLLKEAGIEIKKFEGDK